MAMSNAAFSALLADMRAKKPLVHNITNFVVMNFTANVLLAAGASPAMAHAVEEVADFALFSQALVINPGTLDATFVAGMVKAVEAANARKVPWTLDPVAVGATGYRNQVAAQLAAMSPAVIRANASEIMALAGVAGAAPKGVDSTAGSDAAIDAGRALSAKTGAVIAITGATDYVVAGDTVTAITGGHPISQQVTGTGCASTALVGAFLAVAPPEEAAIAALTLMKKAATLAQPQSRGPGSFAVAFLDALAEVS